MFSSSQTAISSTQTFHHVPKHIQVSGMKCFGENRWREAIMYFLFGIWGNKPEVMCRSKIRIGHITLLLLPSDGTYLACGASAEDAPWEVGEDCLTVSDRQLEVENGLIRFVKDDSIRTLFINIGSIGQVCLWKHMQRARLGIACRHIPSSELLLEA